MGGLVSQARTDPTVRRRVGQTIRQQVRAVVVSRDQTSADSLTPGRRRHQEIAVMVDDALLVEKLHALGKRREMPNDLTPALRQPDQRRREACSRIPQELPLPAAPEKLQRLLAEHLTVERKDGLPILVPEQTNAQSALRSALIANQHSQRLLRKNPPASRDTRQPSAPAAQLP